MTQNDKLNRIPATATQRSLFVQSYLEGKDSSTYNDAYLMLVEGDLQEDGLTKFREVLEVS